MGHLYGEYIYKKNYKWKFYGGECSGPFCIVEESPEKK